MDIVWKDAAASNVLATVDSQRERLIFKALPGVPASLLAPILFSSTPSSVDMAEVLVVTRCFRASEAVSLHWPNGHNAPAIHRTRTQKQWRLGRSVCLPGSTHRLLCSGATSVLKYAKHELQGVSCASIRRSVQLPNGEDEPTWKTINGVYSSSRGVGNPCDTHGCSHWVL